MEPAATIIAELEDYLKRQAMTINQFADISGINSGTLSNLIHGHRPVAMQQLDRITKGMELAEGSLYDVFIDNYIIDSPPDWRRIGPLLLRCAELDKLECIQRVVRVVMDNLMYLPMLFDTAEELFVQGRRSAAALLYESVAEGERYQHSERLALCQYRLFMIALGDNQDVNLRAVNQFEPFVERLDEVNQLDAIKHLADVFGSLHYWDKVNELAEKLGEKATIQYKYWKKDETEKQPTRPFIYYILYAHLLKSLVCDERGEFEKALHYASLYEDVSWVKAPTSEEQLVLDQFQEWAIANMYLYRLMAGQVDVLPQYVNYVESRENEIFPAIFKITQAANRYKFNIDDILQQFNSHLSNREQLSRLGKFNQQLTGDRYTRFLAELAVYYLRFENLDLGLDYLLGSLESSIKIRSDAGIVRCVGLFEKFRAAASQEHKKVYTNLISEVQRINEEKDGFVVDRR